MIRLIRYFVPLLCILALAAHFLRQNNLFLVFVCALGVPFLFIRKSSVVRLMQLFFTLAGVEWLRTTYVLVMERKALDLPWLRMAVILISVAIATLGSTLLLNGRDLR
jgi:hypothetical protein